MICNNPKHEAERLAKLFRQLDDHIETVAAEYSSALERVGKSLETELIKLGYDRPWLQCLQDIGEGRADPCVLRLDPMKRSVLMLTTPARQREIVSQGIAGKPLDRIPYDVLRHEIQGKPKRLSKKQKEKVPVSAHLRSKPGAKDPNPDRVRISGMSLKWHDVVTAVARAAEAGTIPEKEIPRILRAAYVLEKK